MQPYDIAMLVVLGFATVLGAVRGMAWQIASLASVVGSSYAAVRFNGALAPYVGQTEPANRVVAMLVLYLGTSLAIWLAFRLVSGFINRLRLKEFDRQVGGLFGAAKGVLWCLVITFFAVTMSTSARQMVLASRSGYYIALLIHRGGPLLPQQVRDAIGGYLDELHRDLDPASSPTDAAPRQAIENSPTGQWWR
ncbi:MAG: CvpA family protein [Planctomycetia bacterium]|nr:CvpA family protein [Planctomycetia bacterium]